MCATHCIVVYIVFFSLFLLLLLSRAYSRRCNHVVLLYLFFFVLLFLFLLLLLLSVVCRHHLLLCRSPSFVVICLPPSSRVAYHGVLLFRVVFALLRVVVGLVLDRHCHDRPVACWPRRTQTVKGHSADSESSSCHVSLGSDGISVPCSDPAEECRGVVVVTAAVVEPPDF